MSVYATMFVWETSKQKSTSLLALLAVADYADEETGEAFPGIAKLSKKLRMKERNTQSLLRKLADEGELIIAENKGQHTPSGRTNRYTLVGYKEWYQEVQKIALLKKQGVQDSVTRGATFRKQGVQKVAPNPSLYPSENISTAQNSAEKKPRKPNKNEPWRNALLTMFDLSPETVTRTGDKTYWTAAADLAKINFPIERIPDLYRWCKSQKWTNFSVMAMAKHGGEYLAKCQPTKIIPLDDEPIVYPDTSDYVNLAGVSNGN